MLQCLQSFAAAADQDSAVLAVEIDTRRLRSVLDGCRQLRAHSSDDVLHEFRDVCCQSVVHDDLRAAALYFSPSAAAVRPEPAFLMRRSAAGRTGCSVGGPISQFVKYCCPTAHRLPMR